MDVEGGLTNILNNLNVNRSDQRMAGYIRRPDEYLPDMYGRKEALR